MSTLNIFTSPLSPYGYRVRIACALKGLEPQYTPPPGGSGSDDYKQIYAYGRIPALQLDSGEIIGESLAILEYLDDVYPDGISLRPASPAAAARSRMIALLFDHNVITAFRGVFAQLVAPQPDASAARAAFDVVAEEIDRLSLYFDDADYAVGEQISMADVSMAPFAVLMDLLAPKFDCESPTQRNSRFREWWQKMQSIAEVVNAGEGIAGALAAMVAAKK